MWKDRKVNTPKQESKNGVKLTYPRYQWKEHFNPQPPPTFRSKFWEHHRRWLRHLSHVSLCRARDMLHRRPPRSIPSRRNHAQIQRRSNGALLRRRNHDSARKNPTMGPVLSAQRKLAAKCLERRSTHHQIGHRTRPRLNTQVPPSTINWPTTTSLSCSCCSSCTTSSSRRTIHRRHDSPDQHQADTTS